MRLTFDLGTAQYKVALNRLITEKRADAALLLREEARLLIRDIVAFTPPKTFAQGRAAVARDIGHVYGTGAQVIKIAREMGAARVAKLLATALREKNFTAFAHLLAPTTGAKETVTVKPYTRNGQSVGGYTAQRPIVSRPIAQWGGGDVSAELKRQYHLQRRSKYGRVAGRRWSQIVFSAQSLKDYLQKVQDHVGWAKAGWLKAAQLVGLALPSFVSRHLNAPGQVVETGAPNFSITVVNRSSAIPNYQATVDAALRRRQASLISEANRILAGGKSRRGSFAGTATGAGGGS